jgi:hypothetical protein
MAFAGTRRPAFGRLGACLFELLDQSAHRCLIGAKLSRTRIDARRDDRHDNLTSKVNRLSETLFSRMRCTNSRACGNHK